MARKRPGTHVNPVLQEFVRQARHRWALAHHELNNAMIGERMATFLHRDHAYSRQEVGDYIAGKIQPGFTVGCALAWAIDVDPLDLARAYLEGRAQLGRQTKTHPVAPSRPAAALTKPRRRRGTL